MKLLLDTRTLSELRADSRHKVKILSVLASVDDASVFLSSITVGEITKGVALLPKSKKKEELRNWLDGLHNQFSKRVLPVDTDIARTWGEISAQAQANGITIPAPDGLIAATALYHGLHVVTRNTKHFKATGATIIDPWAE